jgi:membrane fusion protein (multidrug efflux system)
MNCRMLIVASAVFACACSQQAAEEVASETVVPVITAAATTGNIRSTITVTGTVTPAPDADQVVIAPQSARIAEIPKAEGDRVRAGDVLVRFDIPELVADVAAKRAEVTRAEARLQNAIAAQTRAHDLFDRGVAARKEVEDADRELADARAGVTESQATLGASQSSASRSTVRARFDGVVAKRFHNPGDLVEAAATDPVIRVVDPRRLEVTASVPIPDVPHIVVGAAAELQRASGGTPIALKVISRPAAVDPGTASVPIRLSFATPYEAPIGTPVQLTINAEEHRNVVLVLTDAVIREADDAAVFIANADKAERRAVTIGLSNKTHTEIVSGVRAGEPVIVKGQAGLPDGATIATGSAESKQ